ncbi:hypothetical protein [Streptomyces sp. TP-A0874]|nr:hypothetical protein [Streptomyces sp. TP-A0874]
MLRTISSCRTPADARTTGAVSLVSAVSAAPGPLPHTNHPGGVRDFGWQ